ncbi:MAG: leucyl/phenylalanyl-tRNA--protein transferase [Paracoccus sp. (in: a-proteobacteria)]|uniref:leucyl/phenylalanyl-tRNA--protein transferase n=1 Tax=Paracoccus sp. TaxID=267 RepID=UPI0039E4343F
MTGLTAERLLFAYAQGVFPMAESAHDPTLYWFDPPERGILPVGGVHVSHSMRRFLRGTDWRATINRDFNAVVAGCADRAETWINAPLIALYDELHGMGHAHSLEVWEGGELVGGTYGISLGGAFFGESMFSRRKNASKAALIWMSGHLRRCGFRLWDTQFLTAHLASMGGIQISRADYRERLKQALDCPVHLCATDALPAPQALSQDMTQTS